MEVLVTPLQISSHLINTVFENPGPEASTLFGSVSDCCAREERPDLSHALDLLTDAAQELATVKAREIQRQEAIRSIVVELEKRIDLYEAERAQLISALGQANSDINYYWNRFQETEKELTELKSAISEYFSER